MSNAAKRIALAWALIAAPVLFFALSFLMGRACPGTQMFWALMLVSHMPFIALPFWAVFHGNRRLAILLGWLTFVVGEVGFFAIYSDWYKEYGWPSPGVPAGIPFGVLFGWPLGWLVAAVAGATKQRVDRRWPILHHD